jgi:hypothetical protein
VLALLALTTLALSPDTLLYSGEDRELEVRPPRIEDSVVDIDGRLDEDVWDRAAVLTDFTQYEPVEGIPATERTEVLVHYSGEAIYFGVRAFDREPGKVQARLGERDRSVFDDDWIRIMLDTFDDQRQAYVFYVNPLGIQTDGLWIEGLQSRRGSVPIDFNPDFLWESLGRVTPDGWVAEIRIPYVSLRFREVPTQAWGINVAREVKRRGFKQSWAPLSQDHASTLAQGGRLVGLTGLEPRRLVELNPVATGRRTGGLTEDEVFQRNGFETDYGLNARYGVTRNLTLDATVNPDFSQVEADANRLTVNERFDIFYPEKRPFFLEGSEIWQMPRNLVHTRQIVDPLAGAKLTGKLGAFQVGYLGALDESPGLVSEGASDAVFNLLRLRGDVAEGSTVGFVYTDRTRSSDDYNRVLGLDARFLFGRYTLTTQLAGSWTGPEDSGAPAGAFQPLLYGRVERSGRTFGWSLELNDVDPGFRTRVGFINRVGDAQVLGTLRHTWYGAPGSLLERISTTLQVDNFFVHDELWSGATPFEHEVQLMPTFTFRGDRSVPVILRIGYFRFLPEAYEEYGVEAAGGTEEPFAVPGALRNMLAVALLPRLRINDVASLNGRVFLREIPIYAEASRGFEVQLAPTLQLRPTTALALELSHTWSRITRSEDRGLFSASHLTRVSAQYQFARSFFGRVLVQYDLTRRDALTDPRTGRPLLVSGEPVSATEGGEFQGQLLLQYEPSPGTIFYVGYSRLERGARSLSLARMDPVEDGLFLKLSYLFRM